MDNLYAYRINSRSRLQVSLQGAVTTVQLYVASKETGGDRSTSHSSHSFTTGRWQSAPVFHRADDETITVTITAEQIHRIRAHQGQLHIASETNGGSAHTTNNNATHQSATHQSATHQNGAHQNSTHTTTFTTSHATSSSSSSAHATASAAAAKTHTTTHTTVRTSSSAANEPLK